MYQDTAVFPILPWYFESNWSIFHYHNSLSYILSIHASSLSFVCLIMFTRKYLSQCFCLFTLKESLFWNVCSSLTKNSNISYSIFAVRIWKSLDCLKAHPHKQILSTVQAKLTDNRAPVTLVWVKSPDKPGSLTICFCNHYTKVKSFWLGLCYALPAHPLPPYIESWCV